MPNLPTSPTIEIATITVKAIVATGARPADIARMAALGTLTVLAAAESSPTYRMTLGQLRGAYRRALTAKEQRLEQRRRKRLAKQRKQEAETWRKYANHAMSGLYFAGC